MGEERKREVREKRERQGYGKSRNKDNKKDNWGIIGTGREENDRRRT